MEYHLDGDGVVLDETDVGGINDDSNGTGEDDGLPPLAWRSLESPAAALASRDQFHELRPLTTIFFLAKLRALVHLHSHTIFVHWGKDYYENTVRKNQIL